MKYEAASRGELDASFAATAGVGRELYEQYYKGEPSEECADDNRANGQSMAAGLRDQSCLSSFCITHAYEVHLSMKASTRCIVMTALSLTACSDGGGSKEIVSQAYRDRDEAGAAKSIDQGWLPAQLPASSVNILEAHNIDSGEVWIKVSLSGGDLAKFVERCNRNLQQLLPNARRTMRAAPWWPSSLMEGAGKGDEDVWQIYTCPRMNHGGTDFTAGLAVAEASHEVFYWLLVP